MAGLFHAPGQVPGGNCNPARCFRRPAEAAAADRTPRGCMTAALLLWSPENRHGEASPSAGVCLSRSCRVDKQKLFSVLFCSGTMLLYFFGTLYDRAKSRQIGRAHV